MKINLNGYMIPVSFKEIIFFKPKTVTEVICYIDFCVSFLIFSCFNVILTFITYNDMLVYESNLSLYFMIPCFLFYSALGGLIYLIFYFFAVKKLITKRYNDLIFEKTILHL